MSASTVTAPSGAPRVLIRRAVAAVADLVAVGVAPILVGLAALERFELIAGPDSGSRFSPEDQARINEIDQVFNRAIELDGTVYTLSGAGWWWTVGLLAAATLVIHIVVPSLSDGRSPGKSLVGLRVISLDGGPARAQQHLLRSLGGVVDAMPLAVPGLLGWIVVGFDPDRRRIGDWLGRTAVVSGPSRPAARDVARRGHTIERGHGVAVAPRPLPVADRRSAPAEIILAETGPARPARPRAPERATIGPDPQRRPGARPATEPIRLAKESEYRTWGRLQESQPRPRTRSASTTFEELALPESSLADQPLTTKLLSRAAETHGDDPIWSDRCSSWVYHDPASDLWFRHDTGSGRWERLDRSSAV